MVRIKSAPTRAMGDIWKYESIGVTVRPVGDFILIMGLSKKRR